MRRGGRAKRRAEVSPRHGADNNTALPDLAQIRDGLAKGGNGRILLLACGALAREVIAIKALNQLDHMDLQCLPAMLHHHPDRIPRAVADAVAKHGAGYDKIFVLYADCGTGGQLQSLCQELGIEMLQGPHCYSFFEGNALFAERAEAEMTAFYLTDFLVRQFDAFITKPLGLNRHPDMIGMYFGSYTKLIYQAQIDDPKLTEKARACAEFLGLEFERRLTGYGDLASALTMFPKPAEA